MQKYIETVTDAEGNVINGAQVTVYAANGGALATIYSDDGVTTTSNPTTSDSNGRIEFYAANGRYNIKIVNGASTAWVNDVLLDDPGDVPIGGGSTYAWDPALAVTQFGSVGAIAVGPYASQSLGGPAQETRLDAGNCYLDSAKVWRYAQSGPASLMIMSWGSIEMFSALTGTANTAITWTPTSGLFTLPNENFSLGVSLNIEGKRALIEGRVRLEAAASTTIPSSVPPTAIELATVVASDSDFYDLTDPTKVKVLVAGVYSIHASAWWIAHASQKGTRTLSIDASGVSLAENMKGVGDGLIDIGFNGRSISQPVSTGDVSLAAGTEIKLLGYQASGVSSSVVPGSRTFLSIAKR